MTMINRLFFRFLVTIQYYYEFNSEKIEALSKKFYRYLKFSLFSY